MSQSPRASPDHLLHHHHHHDDARKRVAKACDRCRLKKIKCDGRIPCTRCKLENAVCRFGDRRKAVERRVPPGYVEYLEEQQRVLVAALRITYKAVPNADASPDLSIHQILENLKVLDNLHQSTVLNAPFHFEEDLDSLRDQWDDHVDAASDAPSAASQRPSMSSSSPSSLTFGTTNSLCDSSSDSLSMDLNPSPPAMARPLQDMQRPSFDSQSSSSSSSSGFSLSHMQQQQQQQHHHHVHTFSSPPLQQQQQQPHQHQAQPLPHHAASNAWLAMPGDSYARFPAQAVDMFGLDELEFSPASFEAFPFGQMTVAPALLSGTPMRPGFDMDMDLDDASNWRKWGPNLHNNNTPQSSIGPVSAF